MKIALTSDLHLEFRGHQPLNLPTADVLVLAGDVLVAEDLRKPNPTDSRAQRVQRYRSFLDSVAAQYAHVVYVAGNHEFYHGKFNQTLDILRRETARYTNLYFLENNHIDIDNTRFLGGTLWTDCNNHDPQTMLAMQYGLNDYNTIVNDVSGYTKLRPQHTLQRHIQTRNYIARNITHNTVVVTHHAPAPQSIAPEYCDEYHLNGGYASDLTELILEHQPHTWLHGHMHHEVNYRVGETTVRCSPRGYPGQNLHYAPQVFTLP